jgi:hypothetical protein
MLGIWQRWLHDPESIEAQPGSMQRVERPPEGQSVKPRCGSPEQYRLFRRKRPEAGDEIVCIENVLRKRIQVCRMPPSIPPRKSLELALPKSQSLSPMTSRIHITRGHSES